MKLEQLVELLSDLQPNENTSTTTFIQKYNIYYIQGSQDDAYRKGAIVSGI